SASACHLSLRSFPTRRSSDLVVATEPLECISCRYARCCAFRYGSSQLASAGHYSTIFIRKHVNTDHRFCCLIKDLQGQCGCHATDRKSTRLNSSHVKISYAGF